MKKVDRGGQVGGREQMSNKKRTVSGKADDKRRRDSI